MGCELTMLLLPLMRMALVMMMLLMIMRCKKFCGELIEKPGTACEIARDCKAWHCCCCCFCCCCLPSTRHVGWEGSPSHRVWPGEHWH